MRPGLNPSIHLCFDHWHQLAHHGGGILEASSIPFLLDCPRYKCEESVKALLLLAGLQRSQPSPEGVNYWCSWWKLSAESLADVMPYFPGVWTTGYNMVNGFSRLIIEVALLSRVEAMVGGQRSSVSF
jgi:hypothetical protein